MGTAKEAPKALPPYVSYRTFVNFVASLRQAMPGRIDRTLMGNLSGAVQSQLFGALRYLHLVNEQEVPQPIFERLVKSEGEEQKAVLKEILQASYPYLFNADGFNLANATSGQFEDQFRKSGAGGDTIRKCGTFFLSAAKDAEIPISPRITKVSKPRSNGAKPARPRANQGTRRPRNIGEKPNSPGAAPQTDNGSPPQTQAGSVRLIDLSGGGSVTLSISVDWFAVDDRERRFVLHLVDAVRQFERGQEAAEDSDDEEGGFGG